MGQLYEQPLDDYEADRSRLWSVRLDGAARVVEGTYESTEEQAARAALIVKYRQYAQVAVPGPVLALEVERRTSWP